MSIVRKAQIVHALLLALALWPLIHIGMVWRYDVSPWKLAGWGMYSAPRFGMIGMEVYGRGPAGGEWEMLTAPSAEINAVAVAFLESHRWLRRLAADDELIATIRREHTQWDAVRIVVAYPRIDLATGMVVLATDERRHSLH